MKKIQGVVIVLTLSLLVGCGVNDIPSYDEQVKSSWSEVENQYQRRSDLIPNLVSVVKQASKHEQDTLVAIVKARANLNTIPKNSVFDNKNMMEKYQGLQGSIGTNINLIMRQMERYPSLQANQNYLQLSSQIEGTENRIAIARREFIKSIESYNIELKTYPGKFYYQYLYSEYKPRTDSVYFHMQNNEDKAAPEVKF